MSQLIKYYQIPIPVFVFSIGEKIYQINPLAVTYRKFTRIRFQDKISQKI